MTRPEEHTELSLRWSEWLLRRNRRGMRGVLCLYPTFGVLDYLVAPERWLPRLYTTRAIVTLATLALFPAVPSAVFRRYPNAISAGYMLLISLGISLMTVFMGGLASPYYAGLSLILAPLGLMIDGPSPCDAYAAARDVAAVVGASVARDVPIVLDLEGDGWIDCVAEEFNQVLSNLIENTLEAAPKGGSGRVVVQGRNDGAELRLSVKDNGPGIPESERARIFDAFYTTKQAGRGMGLGLTITRRVVVGLGGSLKLESEPGKGSEFIIRLPSSTGCREAAS